MDIKNEMETLVRAEVDRVRSTLGAVRHCWCALCTTDVVALALTQLPPLYCRRDSYGYAAGYATAGKIHDAVQSALKRVALRPKHRPGTPRALAEEVGLVNYTFEVGSAIVGPVFGRENRACGCSLCRSDTLAYALNRYPAKYGVRQGTRRSLHPTYLEFMRHELGLILTQAARMVAEHPHH